MDDRGFENVLEQGRFHRRKFLGLCAAGLGATACRARRGAVHYVKSTPAVVVIGGGMGGCAAALSAASRGIRTIVTEETDWLGGQVTAQGVPPDENRWIETFGGTRLYQEYRQRLREYYRKRFPLTDAARANERLNPGNGGVSAICHEPRASVAVLNEMLAPYVEKGLLSILLRSEATAADVSGDRVTSIRVRNLDTGREQDLEGTYFLDATEMGDLLPLTKTEYVTGAEGRSETGELHAGIEARPRNVQAFTCCLAMEYLEGEEYVIEKPREYAFWRSYVPELIPPWPGPLLDWRTTHPQTLEPRLMAFDPRGKTPETMGLFHYRRIRDRSNFKTGTFPADATLVNWPQNDYWLGNLYDVPEEEAARHLYMAKQLSLSLLYWMQTEAPRTDGGTGWPGLQLCKAMVDTDDGLAKYPYIRESRRIRAEFTVLEQHVGKQARSAGARGPVSAEQYADSVGIGYYRIDLHPTSGGDNYIDVESLPFQIPLGALIPRRVENLLPACKNLGVTHITNGCYRLHPVEWNIGESAGALAAFCLERKTVPRKVRNTASPLADFQKSLQRQGVRLTWPEEVRG